MGTARYRIQRSSVARDWRARREVAEGAASKSWDATDALRLRPAAGADSAPTRNRANRRDLTHQQALVGSSAPAPTSGYTSTGRRASHLDRILPQIPDEIRQAGRIAPLQRPRRIADAKQRVQASTRWAGAIAASRGRRQPVPGLRAERSAPPRRSGQPRQHQRPPAGEQPSLGTGPPPNTAATASSPSTAPNSPTTRTSPTARPHGSTATAGETKSKTPTPGYATKVPYSPERAGRSAERPAPSQRSPKQSSTISPSVPKPNPPTRTRRQRHHRRHSSRAANLTPTPTQHPPQAARRPNRPAPTPPQPADHDRWPRRAR